MGQLQTETAALGKERALQAILKKMLAVQVDKVAKLKELIEDHKEKELSTQEAVTHLRQLVKKETHKIEDHLEALKNIADKVRDEEMDRINRLSPLMSEEETMSGEMSDESPLSGELSGESPEIDFGLNELKIGRPIKSANRIKSMKKIKNMKKIKSITVSLITHTHLPRTRIHFQAILNSFKSCGGKF